MKRELSPNRIINANDTSQSGILEKGHYEALNSLESPTNLYRVIFAVARLTEGWDVLNLFDIVRLSDDPKAKGTKATTMSEAQLIGRDRKSTRLNSSHVAISYAVFCLKKKKT